MLDHVLDCICAYTKSFELRDATSRDDSTGGVCVLQRPCHVPVCTIGISTNHHQIRPKTTGMVVVGASSAMLTSLSWLGLSFLWQASFFAVFEIWLAAMLLLAPYISFLAMVLHLFWQTPVRREDTRRCFESLHACGTVWHFTEVKTIRTSFLKRNLQNNKH